MQDATPQDHPAVIITGGGSGLGRAVAHLFATENADVLVVGRTPSRLAETAKGRPTIRTYTADIIQPDTHAKIVTTALNTFGRIDVLVNNAAVTLPAKLGDIDRDEAYLQISTNLVAPLLLSQEVVKHMGPGSVIINITSNPAERGWPTNSVYGCTKVGLDFLTRTWAVELAPRGIRVISIAPGVTETPMLDNPKLTPEEIEQKRKNRRIPIGRTAKPEEIAWWVVTATKPAASYMTGAVVRVDGGVSIT